LFHWVSAFSFAATFPVIPSKFLQDGGAFSDLKNTAIAFAVFKGAYKQNFLDKVL